MSLKLLTLYNEFSAKNFEKNDDDDLFDKFSRKFSTIMMLIFAFVLSTAQLVGEPIKCWCPNEFSKSRCEYATTHCYITSQYIPVTNGSNIPSREKLLSHQIIYYQWVAYMFLLQAIIFYLPCLVWLEKFYHISLENKFFFLKEIIKYKNRFCNTKLY
jgi:hypothetical protein